MKKQKDKKKAIRKISNQTPLAAYDKEKAYAGIRAGFLCVE